MLSALHSHSYAHCAFSYVVSPELNCQSPLDLGKVVSFRQCCFSLSSRYLSVQMMLHRWCRLHACAKFLAGFENQQHLLSHGHLYLDAMTMCHVSSDKYRRSLPERHHFRSVRLAPATSPWRCEASCAYRHLFHVRHDQLLVPYASLG